MRSLADEIRQELAKSTPGKPPSKTKQGNTGPANNKKASEKVPVILQAMLDYDNSMNKHMVHVRFDKQTVALLNKFKMATDVDLTRFVAFAVKHLVDNFPDIRAIIKQFIQNSDHL